jgi:hypothetical protein
MEQELAEKHKIITEDIEKYENYSDDEFDIFENFKITNAYSTAKKKV